MRFFFKSRKFKVIVATVVALAVLTTSVAVISNLSSPISSLFGAIATPIQKAFSSVSAKIDKYKASISDNNELLAEIEKLREENAKLSAELVDYESVLEQNAFYEEFLGIKEKNPDMLFQIAMVTTNDVTDPYKGFTINAGLLNGVSLKDPVITPEGLVGYVCEVAPTYSKVCNVFSPSLKAGGKDSRTSDEGVVSGGSELAIKGKTGLYNLKRDCSVSIGDHIVTIGGSVFPAGLVVGKVSDIKQQVKDNSLYAVIEPAVDFEHLRDVMIITYFSGQGSVQSGEN